MVVIGVLKELPWYDNSPWASPSFGIRKKTGDIRIITDFRELNKWVKWIRFHFQESMKRCRNWRSSSLQQYLIYHLVSI